MIIIISQSKQLICKCCLLFVVNKYYLVNLYFDINALYGNHKKINL